MNEPVNGEPLRIAINATAAVTGGGVTYWLNLLPALASLGRPHRYEVLFSEGQRRFPLELPENFRVRRVGFPRPTNLFRLAWEQASLPILLARERIDVLLAAADMAPLLAPCPVVMAVRNPNPYWGPKASTLPGRVRERALKALTRLSAARAAHVFFVSEDSRRRIAPALSLSPAKTSVVYHGIGPAFLEDPVSGRSPRPEVGPAIERPQAPYVLSVSTVRVHKDFATLLRAFAEFRKASPEHGRHRLVIAGALIDRPYHASLRALASDLGIDGLVEYRGEVPYAALPDLYRGASMFVLPSLAETFGHPFVEAMASGIPVIVTRLDVVQEICAGAGDYFEPGDWKDLAAKMVAIASDSDLRGRRGQAGRQRAREFSWERCARETLALLEREVYRARRSPAKALKTV